MRSAVDLYGNKNMRCPILDDTRLKPSSHVEPGTWTWKSGGHVLIKGLIETTGAIVALAPLLSQVECKAGACETQGDKFDAWERSTCKQQRAHRTF